MPRKARKPQAEPYSPQMAAATFYPGEDIPRRFSTNTWDRNTIARCVVQTLWLCVTMNAKVCASQRWRVLRPARGSSRKIWNGRKLNGKTLRYLRGMGRTMPSHKAMEFADDAGDIEEVTEGPARELLKRPDPFASAGDWFLGLYWSMEAVGKALLYSPPESRVGGIPTSLYQLMPQYARLQPSRTRLFDGVWYGRSKSDEFFVDAADLLYLRAQQHPENPVESISWPQSVQLAADAENAAMTAEIARWNNGGQPGMVLKLPKGATADQQKQAAAAVAAQVRGVNKAGGTMILVDAEMILGGAKPHEMNYPQGLQLAFDRIRMAAGPIPESYFKMGSSSLASAWRADPQYMGEVIQPRIDKCAAELTEKFQDWGLLAEDEWIQYDCPVAEDDEATHKRAMAGAQAGLITPNEYRAEIGYDPAEDEWADQRAVNGVPVATLIDGSAAAAEAARRPVPVPSNGGDGGTPDRQPARPADGAASEGPDTAGKNARHAMGRQSDCCTAHVPKLKSADLPKEVTAQQDLMATRLARLLKPVYAEALTAEGAVAFGAAMAKVEETVYQSLLKVGEAAGNDALAGLGLEPTFNIDHHPATIAFMRDRGGELIVSVQGTIKEAVQTRLTQGMEQGRSLDQIREDIRAEAGDLSSTQAERIARTETSFAANRGIVDAAKEAGATHKTFQLSGNPCPACVSVAAQNPEPIPMDQPFAKAGETHGGLTLKYDVQDGGVHPQCDCKPRPVFDDGEDQ